MGRTLGLDLGSAFSAFCMQEEKDIGATPSVIAIDKKEQRVIASGSEARKMIGRAPSTINILKRAD